MGKVTTHRKQNGFLPLKTIVKKKKIIGRTKKDVICEQIKLQKKVVESEEQNYEPSAGLFEEKNDTEGKAVFNLSGIKEKKSGILKYATGNSDSENSNYESSNESVSEDSPDEDFVQTKLARPIREKKGKNFSLSDGYFFAHKESKSTTSNRTLSKIKLEQTNIEELKKIYENIPERHKKAKAEMHQYHCSLFEKWEFFFNEGFSILLYGVGSKRNVLNSFCKKSLEDKAYIIVHGFFPSINIKEILCNITEEVLNLSEKFTSIYEHAEHVKSHYAKGEDDLYIVIHSMDGIALRSVKVQMILALLATSPNIHFIASVDHINSPLIWDQIMLSQFKWIWFDTTTFDPYLTETSFENNLLKEQTSHLVLSSLLHVYNSLTPNGRGVFLILAKAQKNSTSNYTGLLFQEWFQECRESFLVNSQVTMQAQLSEFKNHKLLAARKSPEGVEQWYIPVDSATLEQFLESCE